MLVEPDRWLMTTEQQDSMPGPRSSDGNSLIGISAWKLALIDGETNTSLSQHTDVYLHHLFFWPAPNSSSSFECTHGWLLHLGFGAELSPLLLPLGYVYFVEPKNSGWGGMVHAHNTRTDRALSLVLEYTVEWYEFSSDRTADILASACTPNTSPSVASSSLPSVDSPKAATVYLLGIDVVGDGDSAYDVAVTSSTVDTRVARLRYQYDAEILFLAGHLHRGGIDISLISEQTAEVMFDSKPLYEAEAVMSMPSACAESFSSLWTVRKGDVFRVTSLYDASVARTDVMGLFVVSQFVTSVVLADSEKQPIEELEGDGCLLSSSHSSSSPSTLSLSSSSALFALLTLFALLALLFISLLLVAAVLYKRGFLRLSLRSKLDEGAEDKERILQTSL